MTVRTYRLTAWENIDDEAPVANEWLEGEYVDLDEALVVANDALGEFGLEQVMVTASDSWYPVAFVDVNGVSRTGLGV